MHYGSVKRHMDSQHGIDGTENIIAKVNCELCNIELFPIDLKAHNK